MPTRTTHLSCCTIILTGLLAATAHAGGGSDPFGTEALLPPRLAPNPAAEERLPELCHVPLAAQTIGAAEAVDLALCNNPLTRELWAGSRAQAAQVGLAQAAFLPTLDGRLSLSRTDGNSGQGNARGAALTLSWLLFDFGAREAKLEASRQLLAATLATRDSTLQALIFSTLQAYYAAQGARAGLDAALAAENAARQSLVAAESRYRAGTATPSDRLQAQTAWSQATLNRIRAEGEVRSSAGTLANVMGLEAHRPLRLVEFRAGRDGRKKEIAETEEMVGDVAALIERARQARPDLQAAEAQLRAAQSSLEATRSDGLPSLSLGITPAWQDSGGINSHSATVGVSLSLPLFSGYSSTYRIRSAQEAAQVKAAQRDRLNQQIALDVWKAYQNLLTTRHALKTAASLLDSAEESERVALGRYKAGVGTILDVLNAQSALSSARQQNIQTALDWRLQRAALAQAIGTLDAGHLPAIISHKENP